jgi:hypothetical protein
MRMLLGLLLLAACSEQPQAANTVTDAPSSDLEAAAIQAGVIPDPNHSDVAGLYERETDRVCVVPRGDSYRIGLVVDYGEQHCGGSGIVTQDGERLGVTFPAASGCSFDARFEGDRIVFPGQVPDACAALCDGRASIAGLRVDRLSDSVSEASSLRDAKGRMLCGGD